MQYLSSYARGRDPTTGRRRRVIVTIHQPSSQIWATIDNVILLAEGRLMYQGPRKDMNDFFSAYGHPVPVSGELCFLFLCSYDVQALTTIASLKGTLQSSRSFHRITLQNARL